MAADQDIDGRPAWARLAVCLVIATIGNVGMWAIVVIMPAVETEFAADRAGASLPYTLTMLGYALGNVAIGGAVDRFGLRPVLRLSAGVIAAGFALAALAPSLAVLSAVQFLIGLGAAAAFGPLIADISHWFRRRRGIAVAIAASGNYLSGALWPLAIAPFSAAYDWRAAYLALAVIVLATVIPLTLAMGNAPPRQSGPAIGPAAVAGGGRGVILLLCLAGVGCCVAMSMPQVHIVAFCVDLGYGPAVGSQMLSLMLMGGVVSRLIFGLIGDRLGGVRTVLIGSGLQCMALFLYLPFDGIVSLYLVSLVFGLSQGGIVPSYALIVREYLPAAQAGAKVGQVMMSTILGMALGGWLSGAIHDWTGSYTAAFLNGIGWNLLNIAILLTLLVRARGGSWPGSIRDTGIRCPSL